MTLPCRLLIDPPALGAWNMAVDELLLDLAAEGRAALRFYLWSEATLSLGYFQQFDDRRQHPHASCCAVVRRLTGGGAIVHDRELTYSLALPRGHDSADDRDRLYSLAHRSLIAALAEKGLRAEVFCPCAGADAAARDDSPGPAQYSTGTAGQAGSGTHSAQAAGAPETAGTGAQLARAVGAAEQSGRVARGDDEFLCFQRRTLGDVVLGGMKIAGSAQRRRRGAVLQHGSVLLARSSAAPQLPGVAELSGIELTPFELIERWRPLLVEAIGLDCVEEPLSTEERRRVESLVALRYGNPIWTEFRGNADSTANCAPSERSFSARRS